MAQPRAKEEKRKGNRPAEWVMPYEPFQRRNQLPTSDGLPDVIMLREYGLVHFSHMQELSSALVTSHSNRDLPDSRLFTCNPYTFRMKYTLLTNGIGFTDAVYAEVKAEKLFQHDWTEPHGRFVRSLIPQSLSYRCEPFEEQPCVHNKDYEIQPRASGFWILHEKNER